MRKARATPPPFLIIPPFFFVEFFLNFECRLSSSLFNEDWIDRPPCFGGRTELPFEPFPCGMCFFSGSLPMECFSPPKKKEPPLRVRSLPSKEFWRWRKVPSDSRICLGTRILGPVLWSGFFFFFRGVMVCLLSSRAGRTRFFFCWVEKLDFPFR